LGTYSVCRTPQKLNPTLELYANLTVPKKKRRKNEKSIHPAIIMHNENNQKKSIDDEEEEEDDRHEMIRHSTTTRSHQETPSFRPPSSSTVAPIRTAGNSNVRIDTDDDDDEIWTLSKAYQSAQVKYNILRVMVGLVMVVVVVFSHPTFDALFFHSRLWHMYMNICIYRMKTLYSLKMCSVKRRVLTMSDRCNFILYHWYGGNRFGRISWNIIIILLLLLPNCHRRRRILPRRRHRTIRIGKKRLARYQMLRYSQHHHNLVVVVLVIVIMIIATTGITATIIMYQRHCRRHRSI
jgi:hypothetical protein